MALGEAAGYDFSLPGTRDYGRGGFIETSQAEQLAQQTQFAPAQGQAMLPNIADQLAQIEGMTDRYYDTYSKMKSYVEEMNRLGIDVTKPDLTKPGGGDEFKAFKAFEAGILNLSNQLKQQREMRNTLQPLLAKDQVRYMPGVDPTKQVIGEGDYYSTEMEPGMQTAMKILAENPMTTQDKKNQEDYYNQVIGEINTRISQAASGREKMQLENQKNQLTKAYQATKLFAPKTPSTVSALSTQKRQAAVDYWTQAVNVLRGGSADQAKLELDADLEPRLVYSTFSGKSFGRTQPRTVKGKPVTYDLKIENVYVKNGKPYVSFVQPADAKAPIPDEPIADAQRFIEKLVEHNADLGFKATDLLSGLEEAQYLEGKSRRPAEEKVFDAANAAELPDTTDAKQVAKTFKENLAKLTGGQALSPFQINGQTYVIRKNRVYSGYDIQVDGNTEYKEISADDIPVLLNQLGYFAQFVKPKASTQDSTEPTDATALKNKYGL